jgi:hypothetical protein
VSEQQHIVAIFWTKFAAVVTGERIGTIIDDSAGHAVTPVGGPSISSGSSGYRGTVGLLHEVL